MTDTARMPTVYIPHGGGPCFFMDWNPPDFWHPTRDYLENLIPSLPRRPKAILLVSAHWEAPLFTVGTGANPALIYDYYNFPPHTYQLQYPAPGDPALAAQVIALLQAAGIEAAADPVRGYDHGVFIPLKVALPDADIPIVTLSLRADYDPAAHLAAGRALERLRDEDVLIVGSGMSFHNMRVMRAPSADAPERSTRWDDWLAETVASDPDTRNAALSDWSAAPDARHAHPPREEEHLLPLMVVAGAGSDDRGARTFSAQVSMPFSAFQFG